MGKDAGALEHRSPEDLLGTALGTCTLERILGRGGMGVVYLAQQSRPHRQVAVKVLLLSLMPDPARRTRFLQRFRREANAVAALEHPNILPIYEYGEQADLAYLVMPYIAGGTLKDRVERKGPLPLAEAAGFLAQVAPALDYAHAHGVIHRDVKPQNMLLYPDKRLVLSDFGIAKVAEQAAASPDEPTAPQLTTMGHVVGTPDYIAPEQAMGQTVDARADIYSLGVVVFYLVTGRVPFIGPQPMTVAAKHVSEAPPPPRQFRPDLPPAAEQVILKALAKDPNARYRSAGEFSRAFRAALPAVAAGAERAPKITTPAPQPPQRGNAAPAPRPPVSPQGKPGAKPGKSSTRPWVAVAATLLALILVAAGTYITIKSNQSHAPGTPTATVAPKHTPTPRPSPTSMPSPTPTLAPSPSPSPTSAPPPLYQADTFLPQQSDIPSNTELLGSNTAKTPADLQKQLQNLGLTLVVDPSQAQYHWQQEDLVEIDQSGSAYLKVAIAQFALASDAQSYYSDVAAQIQTPKSQRQIGQQEIDGFCCGSNPDMSSYNVIFQDQNIAVIILATSSANQAVTDALSLGANMDKHVHPSAALRPTLWLADRRQQKAAA